MKTFTPTPKAIALREYAGFVTRACKERRDGADVQDRFYLRGLTDAAAQMCKAFGATDAELALIKNIARIAVAQGAE